MPTITAARISRAALTRLTTVLVVGGLMLGALAPSVAADDGLEVTTAVSGRRGRARLQGQLRPDGLLDPHRERRAGAVRRSRRLDRHASRRRVRRRRRQRPARGERHDPTRRERSRRSRRRDADAAGHRDSAAAPRMSCRSRSASTRRPPATSRSPRRRRRSRGPSNGNFPFALTLHNDTAQDVTVSATAAVTDHPDWEVTAEIAGQEQAASTVVEAGGTTSINVTATPPENAAAGSTASTSRSGPASRRSRATSGSS